MKKIVSFFTAFVMVAALVVSSSVTSNATGNGEVTLGKYGILPFLNQKTIDLSKSNINIYLTEADKARFKNEADGLALRWLRNIAVLEDEAAWDTTDPSNPIYIDSNNKSWFDGEGWVERYWYEAQMDYSGISDEGKGLVQTLDNCGTVSNLLASSDFDTVIDALYTNKRWQSMLFFSDDDGHPKYLTKDELKEKLINVLNGKIEEIAMDKTSDYFVGQLKSNLNLQFSFEISEITAEESAKFKIGGTLPWGNGDTIIYAGQLADNPTTAKTLNFGADNQLYDYIINDYINDILSGRIAYNKNNDPYGRVMLKDNRDIIDHMLFIDGGMMIASDDSQTAGGARRGHRGGTTQLNYNASVLDFSDYHNATWPGVRSLMELHSNLNDYGWARYNIPGTNYAEWFNLFLNPAVTYMAAHPSEDLITEAEFDSNGRLTAISKPVLYPEDVGKLYKQNAFNFNQGNGIYRFKLTEKNDFVKDLGEGYTFDENTQEYILDINYSSWTSQATNEEIISIDCAVWETAETAETELAKMQSNNGYASLGKVIFTNRVNPPEEIEVVKLVNGNHDIELETMEDIFEYEITTSIPRKCTVFILEDDMPEALEFANPNGISIKVDGVELSDAEKAQMLTVDGNRFVFSPDEVWLEANAEKG
ncbi:MAG: isopeptide-forming domain-containing fimbrial protein, partial [Clostridia bacterium]|nr:isopeptide-forming domain-containing fimbrial protein [Clostridia bacterium]